MNSSHPSKSTGKSSRGRDEITVLRCETANEPWNVPVDEFAAWIDTQITQLEVQFAQYSTVSGRRKSFSR
jgi:hypothetical protein